MAAGGVVLKWATISKLKTGLPFWCKYSGFSTRVARMMADMGRNPNGKCE